MLTRVTPPSTCALQLGRRGRSFIDGAAGEQELVILVQHGPAIDACRNGHTALDIFTSLTSAPGGIIRSVSIQITASNPLSMTFFQRYAPRIVHRSAVLPMNPPRVTSPFERFHCFI